MAPTRKTNAKHKSTPLRSVQSGRIGQSSANKNHVLKRNSGKELFPQLVHPQFDAAPEIGVKHIPNQNGYVASVPSPLSAGTLSELERRSKPATRYKATRTGKKAAHIREINLKLRLLQQCKNCTTKRLLALQDVDQYQPPQDVRDTETVPYALARLDNMLPGTQSVTLNIQIAFGFWGYAGTCSTSKIFNFRIENFANPSKLQNLITRSQDLARSMRQVGIHLNNRNVVIVGYEVAFPKGFRYNAVDCSDIKRHEPVTYTPVSSKVLINTACSLKEFFLQAREYASDARGNVRIPIVARIGLRKEDVVWGGEKLSCFTKEWRSDLERKWLAEEQRMSAERQESAEKAENRRVKERMKALLNPSTKEPTIDAERGQRPRTDCEMKDSVTDPAEEGKKLQSTQTMQDEDDFEIDLDLDLDCDFELDLDLDLNLK